MKPTPLVTETRGAGSSEASPLGHCYKLATPAFAALGVSCLALENEVLRARN
jgi:hypothetical protein